MNFFKLFLFLFVGTVLISSCDNDFDLTTDWKSIPVVYGLINPSDTAYFIRVEKAFLDPVTDPETIAQRPDSLYFDNILVELHRSGASENTYTLERVDGNSQGFTREEGYFANSPNYLYKLKLSGSEKLQPGDQLELNLTIGENSQVVSANTVATGDYELTRPVTQPNGFREIGFLPDRDFSVKWRDDDETSFLFDINYYIHYREKLDDGSPFESKMIPWEVARGFKVIDKPSSITYELASLEFYQILNQSISVVPDAIRLIDSIDVEILGAGIEVLDYISVGEANTGITSSQVIPTYTNLSEGRGIFSSTGKIYESGFRISQVTLDSLEQNILTKALNFQ